MTLPYVWSATGTVLGGVPAVGDVFPYEHTALRITEILSVHPMDDGTTVYRVTYMPVGSTDPDDQRTANLFPAWLKYPDRHYPVCADCGEPTPCRERTLDRLTAQATAAEARFGTEGVCPACQNIVTTTEQSMHYPDNVVVPFGPPVTFHWRAQCRNAAVEYDTAWARVLGRRPLLTCPGAVMWHKTTYECTAGDGCSGSWALHAYHAVCACRESSINKLGPLPTWQEIAMPAGGKVSVRHHRVTVAPSDAALSIREGL